MMKNVSDELKRLLEKKLEYMDYKLLEENKDKSSKLKIKYYQYKINKISNEILLIATPKEMIELRKIGMM